MSGPGDPARVEPFAGYNPLLPAGNADEIGSCPGQVFLQIYAVLYVPSGESRCVGAAWHSSFFRAMIPPMLPTWVEMSETPVGRIRSAR